MALSKSLLIALFIIFSTILKAQNADSLLKKLPAKLRIDDNPGNGADLFMHLDKTVYLTDERIWFSAYLLHAMEAERYHTLYVLLVNDMNMKVVTSQRFVLDNDLGAGNFLIPDSLQSGEYSVIAYTNRISENRGETFFRQPVHIFGAGKDPFKLSFTGEQSGDSIKLVVTVLNIDGENTTGKIAYSVYSDGRMIFESQQKIDNSGKIWFIIPAAYSNKPLEIRGAITEGKQKMVFKRPLNWSSALLQIEFFPEGENLIDGQPNKIAFTVKNTSGKALSTLCTLYEDKHLVASISSDIYGRGTFNFTPRSGKIYLVKCEGSNVIPLQQFPPIKSSSWNLHIKNGLISDTLKLAISGPAAGSEGYLVVHNLNDIFYSSHIALPHAEGLLSINSQNWPSGTAMVSLFDKSGTLKADRAIFLKSTNMTVATITADSAAYHKLSKVTVTVKLRDNSGKPVKGLFSFSSTLAKAVNAGLNDISRFDNYERFTKPPLTLMPWSYLKQETNAETTLLQLHGDSGYGRLSYDPSKLRLGKYDGHVSHDDKKLKKPMSLLLSGNSTQLITTNSDGFFNLPYLPLRSVAGKNILLSVVDKNPLGYRIFIDTPLKRLNDLIAKQYFPLNTFISDDLSEQDKQQIGSSKSIKLNEVVIKAKSDGMKGYNGTPDSSGNCDDYVCYLGFLNCKAHPKGTPGTHQAIDGETYFVDDGPFGHTEQIVYHCQFKTVPPYIQIIRGTAFPEAFDSFNLSGETSPRMLNRTTLYWQPYIKTDNNGEATITFYTDKLGGKFVGSIQGISENGVFSAYLEFNVVN